MVRNIINERPIAPPTGLICGLVVLIELMTAWTTVSAVTTVVDRDELQAGTVHAPSSDAEPEYASSGSVESKHPRPDATDSSREESSDDARLAGSMVGVWEDDYKGHRTLTLRPDGTGSMVVELDGLAATLFAAKLTFTEEWSVSDGKVTMKATGGEPAGKVRLVLSLHGDSSLQRIVEVTGDRMILVEEPSGTRFEWRRAAAAE